MLRRSLALTLFVGLPLMACSDAANTAPATPPNPADVKAFDVAAKATGLTLGPMMAAQTVYIFFDPACPHCAHLWANVQPLAKKLRMVWIPVGWLRPPRSLEQGAAILAAPNPVAAMVEHEAKFRQGGIPVPADLPEAVKAQVKSNTELFLSLGPDSVPLIVFKHGKTGQAGTATGALSTEEFAKTVGL